MEYIELMQMTIDFIEEHITERLTVDELAAISGFSTYHYYRIFHSYVGMPVMEYVTRRKLQHSLFQLGNGDRILDIAINYGFDTHAGYNKAFKRVFGYSPKYYRIHAPEGFPQKVDLVRLKQNETGGIVMEPKIINKEMIKIVGYKFDTTLRNNAHSRDIPAFWDKCDIEGKEARLYETQNIVKHGEYGICINTDLETDELSYILGVEVESFEQKLDEMCAIEIPEATYAVFTTPEVMESDFIKSIKGTWKYILEEWFPNSGYEIDDHKLDFEFYDEHCHPWEHEKLSMNIFVPIKKR